MTIRSAFKPRVFCAALLVCGWLSTGPATSAELGQPTAGGLPVVYHYPLPSGTTYDPTLASYQALPTVHVYPPPPGSTPEQVSPAITYSGSPGVSAAGDQRPVAARPLAAEAPPEPATPFWSGTYLAFRLLPSLSNVSDISRMPSAPIGLADDTIEFVAAAAVALGYDWRPRLDFPLKTELEYRYRYHFDIETRSATTRTFYDASTKAGHTLQLNAWIPWTVSEGLDVFVGGGVGITRHRTETNRNNTMTMVREQRTDNDDEFSWHVGLGADYRFAENWSLEAMYRYADLGEIEVGPFSTGDSVTYGRVFSHEFVFGIAYYF